MNNNKNNELLIVDDQVNLLTTLKFIFEDNGFNVTMVSSGIEAVKRIKEKSYDIVLLDVNMPEMDGLETFREIKKHSPTSSIIMMTGNKESAQVKKCIEEGAYTVVYKPFAVKKLIKIMKRAAERPIVLVVDDRRDDRIVLRNALEIEDYRVVEASDGINALDKIKKGNFDICLVDYRMPRMNGLETIDRIKKENPDVGVILMSGYSLEDAIKREIEKREGLAFIKKPYDINVLVDVVTGRLKRNTKKE